MFSFNSPNFWHVSSARPAREGGWPMFIPNARSYTGGAGLLSTQNGFLHHSNQTQKPRPPSNTGAPCVGSLANLSAVSAVGQVTPLCAAASAALVICTSMPYIKGSNPALLRDESKKLDSKPMVDSTFHPIKNGHEKFLGKKCQAKPVMGSAYFLIVPINTRFASLLEEVIRLNQHGNIVQMIRKASISIQKFAARTGGLSQLP